MKLIIMRHGDTEWSNKSVFMGQIDIALSEKGISDVEKIKEKIKKLNPQKVVCSDLQRTKQTAKIITQNLRIDYQYIDKLREEYLGDWQGKSKDQVKKIFPNEYQIWAKRSLDPIGSREGIRNAGKRAKDAIDRQLKELKQDECLLVVTHANISIALIGMFIQIPEVNWFDLKTLKTSSWSILELNPNGKWRLCAHNCN